MRQGAKSWLGGIPIVVVIATLGAATSEARAQDFKIPLSASPFVYRPGENIAELEDLNRWTFGLGLIIGVQEAYSARQRGIYGLVAQATFGGPYAYIGAGAGMWNSGSSITDNFGFGLNGHYNVFQSRDFRTRLGPQFAWSTGSDGLARTHVFTYRALVSHTLNPSLTFYGGLGAETSKRANTGDFGPSTNPSLLAGIYTRLGDRFGLSTGVESVFSEPLQLNFATSVQFEGAPNSDPVELTALRGRRVPGR